MLPRVGPVWIPAFAGMTELRKCMIKRGFSHARQVCVNLIAVLREENTELNPL